MPSAPRSRKLPLGLSVGILGGGQLARMLCQAAYDLGLEPWVLSAHADDPAAQVTPHWIKGDPGKIADLKKISQHVQCLTFESEFFDMQPLTQISSRAYPQPRLMKQLQDRRTQKKILVDHGIPTARFIAVNTIKDLNSISDEFSRDCVLKKSQGGYDGYGTFHIRSERDLVAHQQTWRGPYIAEERMAFQRELAMMLFRNADGEFLALPLVESVQTNSKCDLVWGPIDHRAHSVLVKKFQKMLDRLHFVGTLGVELFDVGGKLFVNELAPRVHNSGHYSIDALSQSQFHLHWKAILNLPLTEPTLNDRAFVMTNLIGESKSPMKIPGSLQGSVHWYGKLENRPGRKMGHINYVGPKQKKLVALAVKERNRISK